MTAARSSPSAPALPASTLHGLEAGGGGRTASWGRRVFLVALLVVVLTGLTGALGEHSTTATAEAEGYRVELRYASVARAGLDLPWQVEVTHAGGFDGPVTLELTGSYLDLVESQGWHPEPSASTRGAETLLLEFDPPPGETLVVVHDSYVAPSRQVGASGVVAVRVDGRSVAPVPFRTVLLP